jgi:hypothetical protein
MMCGNRFSKKYETFFRLSFYYETTAWQLHEICIQLSFEWVCGLLYDAVNSLDHVALDDRIINV